MSKWSIEQARQLYNIEHWGAGYFDINQQGHVVVHPAQRKEFAAIDLLELTQKIQESGLSLPVLVRFNDILHHRIQKINQAFNEAIEMAAYENKYTTVYPIKVNQQCQVVEQIIKEKYAPVGLEAGSKPELLAVLGLPRKPGSLVICNGYKDREFIRLALIGQKLGHQVFIIIEQYFELQIIIEEAKKMGVKPNLGVRARLATMGSGKWQKSAGAKSKFGLSAAQIIELINQLEQEGWLDCLQLLHFHLGSQIANIRDIQKGMRECARYYAELRTSGAHIKYVDVGGGLAIDYQGTKSRHECSANYTVLEYANNIIYALQSVCEEYELPHPHILTESGRAITAHHAMLITEVIDVESVTKKSNPVALEEEDPQILHDMWQAWEDLDKKSAIETYHDATQWLSEAQTLYTHGVITLAQRAQVEELFFMICRNIYKYLNQNNRMHQEVIDELNETLADKYFCNFSLFQSLPDVWAIDQIFPILPLGNLDKVPERRAILHDLTCDSDGCVDLYVNEHGIETTLPLPNYNEKEPYYLGVFLVGAYQEILGDMHNLFGDTNSIHVERQEDGSYTLLKPEIGDSVREVLQYVHFECQTLVDSYRRQMEQAHLTAEEKQYYLEELELGMQGYTYFEE